MRVSGRNWSFFSISECMGEQGQTVTGVMYPGPSTEIPEDPLIKSAKQYD